MTVDRVLEIYKEELLKRRHPRYVDKRMADKKRNVQYAEKLIKNLQQWELLHLVDDYIEAQFFALDYMPQLPNMIHIASDKGLERYEKVRGFYKEKTARIKNQKANKRTSKIFDEEYYLSLLEVNDIEEEDKELRHNTDEGLLLCITDTSLYNPKSNLCKECIYKEGCEAVLAKRNEPLWKARLGKINSKTYIKKVRKEDV